MAITDYKKLFTEYHCGPISFLHMLSKPIAAKRDINIHQGFLDKLSEATTKSTKKISTKLVFYGNHDNDKAMQLNHLAYKNKNLVCLIDCQKLVDNYIGETEKHFSRLIAQASSQSWILFFDEADALFGKRTQVKDAHDKYANQEVSYLLNLLSQYPGLSILSLTGKSDLANIRYKVDGVINMSSKSSLNQTG